MHALFAGCVPHVVVMIQDTSFFDARRFLADAILGALLFCCPAVVQASSGGIDTSAANSGYAWSNVGGWVNFGTSDGNVTVTDSAVIGYVWDANYGWLNLAPSTGGVTNDGQGNLGGYAWSTGGGWISFEGITIDDDGRFRGVTPVSATYGRLSFDCARCNVVTTWRKTVPSVAISTTPRTSASASPLEQPVPAPRAPITALSASGAEGMVPDIRSATKSSPSVGKLLPEQLFDIRLIVDRRQISSASELVVRTTFESFGRVPTTVGLEFSILNPSGVNVYAKKDTVVIETEGVLVTRFDGVDLPTGKYVVRLRTVYHTDITDNFEIPFEIAPSPDGEFPLNRIFAALVALAALFFALFMWKRRRGTEVGAHKISTASRV